MPTSAGFSARSNAFGVRVQPIPRFGSAFIGWGLVTRFAYAPVTVSNLIEVVARSADAGTITGTGGDGAGATITAWLALLSAAEASIDRGNHRAACAQLRQAHALAAPRCISPVDDHR